MIPLLNIDPILFGLIVGGTILLVGPWLLRKAGTALLLLIACALASDLWGWLTWSGWLSPTAGGQIAVYLVGVALALILARNRLGSRAAQIACSLALCAVAGSTLASWLGWSEPLLWAAILLGSAIFPPAAAALLATAIFCGCADGVTWYWTAVILAASVSISWTVACRGRRKFWDPTLRAGTAGKIRLAAQEAGNNGDTAETEKVFFDCDSQVEQRHLIRWLGRRGIRTEEFPGGFAAADIPGRILLAWKRRWRRLFQICPDRVVSGAHQVIAPPVAPCDRDGVITRVEQAGQRIRSNGDNSLPDHVASGEGIRVAILDTGANPVTPSLRRALKNRVSYAADDPSSNDHRGHGTAVAACVLAVAPEVDIESVKVLNGEGVGTLDSLMRGLKHVADHRDRIDLMNLSLGAHVCGGQDACPLCRALIALARLGVPSCTAMGNSGPEPGSVECPGASSGTLGVAATDMDGNVAPWSSRGPCINRSIQKPDVASFGVRLRVPGKDGSPIVASGTSFASPLTAGLMAGIMQMAGKNSFSVDTLYARVRQSCLPAAEGSRSRNATGAGQASLYEAARLYRMKGGLRPVVLLPLRHLAAAAIILLVPVLGWLCLDHVGSMRLDQHSQSQKVLVGRVCASSEPGEQLLFDDGTGVVELVWKGPPDSSPEAGTVIVLRADLAQDNRDGVVLQGRRRIAVW